MTIGASLTLVLVALIFLGIIPHETLRPYATKVLKDYQFDRLDPATHHQKAASTAIALGGLTARVGGKANSPQEAGFQLPIQTLSFLHSEKNLVS